MTRVAANILWLGQRRRSHGYLLLAVSVALIALSMFALSALEISQSEAQRRSASHEHTANYYAAQAGIAHARWQLQRNQSCGGYAGTGATQFESHVYEASISPAAGSPVTLTSKATNSAGDDLILRSQDVPVLRTPETLLLAPGELLADTYVDGSRPNDVKGTNRKLRIGSFSPNHALLKFDLSGLPRGITVLSATLELEYEKVDGITPNSTITVFPMREPWSETKATFEEADDGVAWAWPAAFDTANPVTEIGLDGLDFGKVEFDISTLVRAWNADEIPNHGLVLVAAGGVNNANFYSGDEGQVDRHPTLEISYACECGVICSLAPQNLDVMVLVEKGADPRNEDIDRQELLESWGWSVQLVDDSDNSAEIAAAAADADVVYVSSSVDASKVLGDLANLPVGIVSENAELLVETGFATEYVEEGTDSINIDDVSHYITQGFGSGGLLQLTTKNNTYHGLRGSIAGAAQQLGSMDTLVADPSLAVLESGQLRQDGGVSVARRVNLPWAGTDETFKPFELTEAGALILRRSIEWAAASPLSLGDYRDTLRYRTCEAEPDYHGSDGEFDWSADGWREILDDDLPCSGDVRVALDAATASAGSYQILVSAANAGINRRVDLTDYSAATLSFQSRFENFSTGVDGVLILASTNGVTYNLIATGTVDGTQSAYESVSFDLSAFAGAPAWIGIVGEGMAGPAVAYFDNFVIRDE